MGIEPILSIPAVPEPAISVQHVTLAPEVTTDAPIPPGQHQAENTVQQAEDGTDPNIFAVVQRMNAIKRAEGTEEKTLRQFESFASLFTLLLESQTFARCANIML